MDTQQPTATIETPLGQMVIEVQPNYRLLCRIPVVRRVNNVLYGIRLEAWIDPHDEIWRMSASATERVRMITGRYVPAHVWMHDEQGNKYEFARGDNVRATEAAQKTILAQLRPLIEQWAEQNVSLFAEGNTAYIKGRAEYLSGRITVAAGEMAEMMARITRIQDEIARTGGLNEADRKWMDEHIGRRLYF